MKNTYPFSMMPLPYAYNALEPYIDQQVLEVHYSRNYKTYVDNLNSTLTGYPEFYDWTLENLLTNLNYLPSSIQEDIRNNGGGVYNHQLYFNSMTPAANSIPSNTLSTIIKKSFGSMEWFLDILRTTAAKVFGSGYAWLVITPSRDLAVIMTKNQDTPLMADLTPLLALDVWEHAYFLQYLNMRKDYINSWFHLINWDNIEQNYYKAMNTSYKR